MLVGAERALRAHACRDARFDGWFVVAVRTTGVFCRPSCPARTPKPENVEFFTTTAGARAASYRPCRRCPGAVPGSPEWDLRNDLVARAIRLINDGIVERAGVEGLVAQLGCSEPHLTRVLTEELGVGPLELDEGNRAHVAEQVVHHHAADPTAAFPHSVQLRLPSRAPFDSWPFRFLAARTVAGLEEGGPAHYVRAMRLPYSTGVAALSPGFDHVATTLHLADLRDLSPAVGRLRRLLDLDSDPVGVAAALGDDPALAQGLALSPGVRVPGSVDGAELLIRTVIGQQISVPAARTTTERLVARLGGHLEQAVHGVTRLFPSPADLAGMPDDALPGPRRRAETVRGAAGALADGLAVHPGREASELRNELESLRGVGPWTANYVVMRVLGAPDVLLDGDVALRRGAAALGLPAQAEQLRAHARRWSPWRSYAGMLLWQAGAPPANPKYTVDTN